MASSADIIAQYQKLAVWCDGWFSSISKQFPTEIKCRSGCDSCCILSSVSAIEAAVINHYYIRPVAGQYQAKSAVHHKRGYCPFLYDGTCSIYPVRPLICRTHGAPIRSGDQVKTDCCPLNFARQNIAIIPEKSVLDIDILNQNLARLNTALSIIVSDRRLLVRRYSMVDIYWGRLPQYITRIAASLS